MELHRLAFITRFSKKLKFKQLHLKNVLVSKKRLFIAIFKINTFHNKRIRNCNSC